MSSQPFYVNEIFWGIIGLIGLGIAIAIELRKSRSVFDKLVGYLGDSTQSTVDEKIAVLYSYVIAVPTWRPVGININLMISRIVSDLNSIARIRDKMTWEQWRELHRVLIQLINVMKDSDMDTTDIEATREALR
jgi:hypothetical protein